MNQLLTVMQGYKAMYRFMDLFYEKTKCADTGSLLGSMSFWSKNRPVDAAMLELWADAIAKLDNSNKEALLTTKQAFVAMKHFLVFYYPTVSTRSSTYQLLIDSLELSPDGIPLDTIAWKIWEQCVERVLNEEEENSYYYWQ